MSANPNATGAGVERTSPAAAGADGRAGSASGAAAADTHRVLSTQLGELTEVSSMCPRCECDGVTRLMILDVPHFRQLIVSSFQCRNEDCLEENRHVQFGGAFHTKRVQYKLDVQTPRDLNRQVIKSEFATLMIPEIELELPREAQAGTLNTVEGVLRRVVVGLQHEQPVRRITDPDTAAKLDAFCDKVTALCEGKAFPFTVHLDDPSGNSYIEGYFPRGGAPLDPQLTRWELTRTRAERELCGLVQTHENDAGEYNTRRSDAEEAALDALGAAAEGNAGDADARNAPMQQQAANGAVGRDEIVGIDTPCDACAAPGRIQFKTVDIPGFRETVLMAFRCEACGYRSNEVKAGGAVAPQGKRVTLRVTTPDDLNRDVLKSASCAVTIPEVELELAPGTLGGFFTTVEGLVSQTHAALAGLHQSSFTEGDSAPSASASASRASDSARTGGGTVSAASSDGADGGGGAGRMSAFLAKLQRLLTPAGLPWTLVLDDPLSMVYVQNLAPPGHVDTRLDEASYARTWQQDEELGLHGLSLEPGSTDGDAAAASKDADSASRTPAEES